MLLFPALSSINLTKINKKKFQQMRQLYAYIANESTQNILLDPGTKPVSLVCKRPQAQFHRNLCAVTVCTDFAMMSKNVPKHIYRSNIAWENSRHLATLNHWFSRQMTSEKRAQKFHTDDASLPRSGKSCQRYFFREIHENCYVHKSGIYRKRKTEKTRK